METSTKGRMKTVEDILEHHGVKGQKWGRRKARTSSNKSTKPKAHELSDEDLKKAVSRMQMEKQYKQLLGRTGSNNAAKKVAAVGATFVGGMALKIARSTIQNHANQKIAEHLSTHAARKATKKVSIGVLGPA